MKKGGYTAMFSCSRIYNSQPTTHASKGINFLSYRIKNGITTPSKRIVHNIRWYIRRTIEHYGGRENLIARDAESIMQIVNSYFGLLKWCASFRLRQWICNQLILADGFADVFTISDTKINIKENYTQRYIARRNNQIRKQLLKTL